MSYILNIDTASETAHVSLAQNGMVLHQQVNETQKDHAAFVQPAVKQLVAAAGITLADVAAVAVTAGPGSYTGLRVGMASAKGLCFALNKPFIAVNTLAVMAHAAIQQQHNETALYCPMIDARRMEVFTAVYNNLLQEVITPCAVVLTENSFKQELQKTKIVFFGTGSIKWKTLMQHNSNAAFMQLTALPQAMADLSFQYYTSKQFFDLAYTEPFYIKDFNANT